MVLDEGQVLDGKYVIVRVLATGSMGEVYLGRNERIGKEVAVKVLRRDFADDRAIGHRFEEEARIATAVKSAHVVDVYDLGDLPSGERFIVMEYVEGESLGIRMGREGKLSAHALGGITLQILDGLVAAHAAGVIHRDLKPDNVILSKRDGHELVKLVDFGISKRSEPAPLGGPRRDVKRATLDGMLLGTPTYMSPEQARGEPEGVDHRTDIFSLGVSMYEALSGEVPFNGDNVVALLSQIINDPETPLEKYVPNVDPGLVRIIEKAMAKDPADRYQSAAEMREAVASWYAVFGSTSAMRSSLEGVARTAPPAAPVDLVTLPYVGIVIDRKRARAAAAGAAFAAMFVALVARHPARDPAPLPEPPTVVAISTAITVPTTHAIELPLPPPPKPPEAAVIVPVKKVIAAPPPALVTAPTPRAAKPTTKNADAGAAPARDASAPAHPPKLEEPAPPASASADETPLPDPPAIP